MRDPSRALAAVFVLAAGFASAAAVLILVKDSARFGSSTRIRPGIAADQPLLEGERDAGVYPEDAGELLVKVRVAPAPNRGENTADDDFAGKRGHATLGVLVTDCESGRPLEGAGLLLKGAGAEHRAFTDSSGAAFLDSLPRGRLTIRTVHDGHVDDVRELFIESPTANPGAESEPPPFHVHIRMKKGVHVNGLVLDGTAGIPLAGARVEYYEPFTGTRRTACTDASGRFALSGLPEDLRPEMKFMRWGLEKHYSFETEPGDGFIPDGRGAFRVNLRLQRCGEAAGRVLDSSGLPAGNARVFAYDVLLNSKGIRSAKRDFDPRIRISGIETYAECEAAADEAGRFRIQSIPPGIRIRIAAQVPGHSLAQSGALVLSPGEAVENVFLRALAGTFLTGLVTDLAGRPIAGARVDAYEHRLALFPTIHGQSGEEPRFIDSRETDREGRFAFCGLEPGPYSFRAYKQGFGDAVTGVTMLQEGKSAHKVLRLEKGASTAGGIVLDRRDRPVSGIIVSFIPDPIPEGMTMMPFNARSGSDGRFRISGLWNGVRHSISACDPDGRYVVPRTDNLPEYVLPDGGDFEIRAYLAASVSGRVDALPAGSAPTIVLIEERCSGRGLTRRAAVKDENFRITGLAPGTYSVLTRGKGLTEKNLGTVAVEEGEQIENLVFHYGDSTCITGRVLMAGSGAPAGGLLVSLIGRAQRAEAVPGGPCSGVADETTTDREGEFRFAGVAPGCYDVAVWDLSKGYGSHHSAIVSEGETLSGLVIRLAEGVLVKGLIQPDGLLPSGRANTLVFVNSDRLVRKCAADRLGAFAIRLVPGEYFWTAEKPGSNPDPRCLVIPSACQSLEVVLK